MASSRCIVAAVATLTVAGCGTAPAGSDQQNANVDKALRRLVERCKPHEGIVSYSFRYQSSKYLWTAICKDGEPVIVGGD